VEDPTIKQLQYHFRITRLR